MVESAVKPNKLTLRKLDSDHAYVYVRTNAKVVEVDREEKVRPVEKEVVLKEK